LLFELNLKIKIIKKMNFFFQRLLFHFNNNLNYIFNIKNLFKLNIIHIKIKNLYKIIYLISINYNNIFINKLLIIIFIKKTYFKLKILFHFIVQKINFKFYYNNNKNIILKIIMI